jgi:hypothetical protein
VDEFSPEDQPRAERQEERRDDAAEDGLGNSTEQPRAGQRSGVLLPMPNPATEATVPASTVAIAAASSNHIQAV